MKKRAFVSLLIVIVTLLLNGIVFYAPVSAFAARHTHRRSGEHSPVLSIDPTGLSLSASEIVVIVYITCTPLGAQGSYEVDARQNGAPPVLGSGLTTCTGQSNTVLIPLVVNSGVWTMGTIVITATFSLPGSAPVSAVQLVQPVPIP